MSNHDIILERRIFINHNFSSDEKGLHFFTAGNLAAPFYLTLAMKGMPYFYPWVDPTLVLCLLFQRCAAMLEVVQYWFSYLLKHLSYNDGLGGFDTYAEDPGLIPGLSLFSNFVCFHSLQHSYVHM